jgi:hypothetical protein
MSRLISYALCEVLSFSIKYYPAAVNNIVKKISGIYRFIAFFLYNCDPNKKLFKI